MFPLLKKNAFAFLLFFRRAGEGAALEVGKGNVCETISGSGSFIPEQTHNHPGQSESLGQCSLGKVYFCWPLCSSAFGMLGIVNLKKKKKKKMRVGWSTHSIQSQSRHFPFSCFLQFCNKPHILY